VATNPVALVGRFFGRFFGSTIGEAAGYGIGGAMQEPIKPLLQQLANETWATATAAGVGRPLPASEAAEIVAEDVELRAWGVEQAGQAGNTQEQFDAVLGAVLNAPGLGELFEAWRRNLIDDDAFRHGLRKAKLETRWDGPLMALKLRLLTSDELANAQQQQFIDEARANEEAALQGVTAERQQIRFRLAGLPPGVETALQMLRRKIIDAATFRQIVAEGHTKTKYTDDLLALEQVVLGAQTYAGLHLRGWIDEGAMVAGGEMTGYTKEQMDLLYKEHGRPATGRQVFIGLRRGGEYDGPTTGIDPAFIAAIRQSNIRPEWTNLLWAQRFTYPSAFVLRALTQGGDLTQAETERILLFEGWEPALAAKVSARWAGGAGSTGKELTKAELLTEFEGGYITENELRDHLTALGYSGPELDLEVHLGDARRIRSWRDKAITALGKRYVASTMEATAADGYLVEIGVPDPATRASIIRIWDIEREFK
jgi:hypothetical protein